MNIVMQCYILLCQLWLLLTFVCASLFHPLFAWHLKLACKNRQYQYPTVFNTDWSAARTFYFSMNKGTVKRCMLLPCKFFKKLYKSLFMLIQTNFYFQIKPLAWSVKENDFSLSLSLLGVQQKVLAKVGAS